MNIQSRKLLSISEVAIRMSVSRITCYRWTRTGILPSLKVGGRRLIPESVLDQMIASATTLGGFHD